MNKFRRNCKRLSIWILLFTQILLILSYFYLKIDNATIKIRTADKISFITSTSEEKVTKHTYHTSDTGFYLKNVLTREKFTDFNASLCYQNGTDLISMTQNQDKWQCKCFPEWHGKDCGQPEIIWRALLTYRKPLKITGPRTIEKRIICIFKVDKFSKTMAEIRVAELADVVDLFILYEDDASDFLGHKLDSKFLKQFHKKILYLKRSFVRVFWKYVKNLKEDDIILAVKAEEIPNKFALNYLKFYDNYPEPIKFRSRWSVFGFFWIHPSKTIITGGASSFLYLKKTLNYKLDSLFDNKTLSSPKGIILGDLNHFGGWFCEYCNDITKILEYLSTSNSRSINLDKIDHQKIDSVFLEDVIENGLYIDGKTELIRTHRYRDNYFAPYHVLENNFQYDFLLINFYSKIDYYEG